MLFCTELETERWSPNFSPSGRASATWTKLRSGRTELCNSLEWTAWSRNPVQVELCDACGSPGCSSGGYVHVSAIQDYVMWTMPQVASVANSADTEHFPAAALQRFGGIAFPRETWASIRASVPSVPDAPNLPQANGRALADAWIVGPGRRRIEDLVPMLRARLLAADTLEVGAAIRWVQDWLDRFNRPPDSDVVGNVTVVSTAEIETLYFDGPHAEDWPALVRHGDMYVPALDSTHIFVPTLPRS